MVKAKKEKDDSGASTEDQTALRESKRLQDLAVSRGLLSRSKANPSAPLLPTKTILKCDGKDIVKKGHRKTKYLFSFPGLVAPIAGGKFGELTHLDSRNPTFYIDFPQGRLKLFGTIVYPKNKYLTMHFLPGRGDIVCEDCFESIVSFHWASKGILGFRVVFPEAWWIGTKEDNPEELQLAMPSNLQQEKHANVDFSGGAGRPPNSNAAAGIPKAAVVSNEPESPEGQFRVGRSQGSPSSMDIGTEDVGVRRSARKAVQKLSYAQSSDGSERSGDSASESSDSRRKQIRRKVADEDSIETSSNLSVKDVSMEEPALDEQSKSSVQAAVEKVVGSLFVPTSAEPVAGLSAPRAVLKQATLTSFLTKENTFHEKIPNNVIEIEESPKKTESGVSDRPRRTSRKLINEEQEESWSNEEDYQSSSDSALKKNGGSRCGRGRGRGRGGAKAVTSGGRNAVLGKGATKRRQSITEISSSSDEDGKQGNESDGTPSLNTDDSG